MNVLEHEFRFFNNKEELLKEWGTLLFGLTGDTITAVYGVWDRIYQEWFDDAPVVVQLKRAS